LLALPALPPTSVLCPPVTMSLRKPDLVSPSLLAATDWMPMFTCWLT
jgi:hypothetical protein